jgi:hypothetical protein
MRQPAMLLEVIVPPAAQFAQRVLREEFGRGAQRRQFPGGRLGAFFAEFGGVMIGGLRPGATHAHEAIRLVLAGELVERIGVTCSRGKISASERTEPQPPAGPL